MSTDPDPVTAAGAGFSWSQTGTPTSPHAQRSSGPEADAGATPGRLVLITLIDRSRSIRLGIVVHALANSLRMIAALLSS